MLCHTIRIYILHGANCWPAMVGFGKLAAVIMGSLLMRHLLTGWLDMMFIHSPYFFRARPCSYAAAAAIKAHVVVYYGITLYHGTVDVSIMDHRPVYINYRSIIPEMIARPGASGEAYTEETPAIINTTVKAYILAPVTRVKSIYTTCITPIAGCP